MDRSLVEDILERPVPDEHWEELVENWRAFCEAPSMYRGVVDIVNEWLDAVCDEHNGRPFSVEEFEIDYSGEELVTPHYVYMVDGVESWSTCYADVAERTFPDVELPAEGEHVPVMWNYDGVIEEGELYCVPHDIFCAVVDNNIEAGIDAFTIEGWKALRGHSSVMGFLR